MRSLVILRGCPGSGKSTWIKENHLEQYTLSPDTIRTMVCAPVLTENESDVVISQENDTYVWSLLFEILERRMKNGDFTIIDATHSKSSDFSRYNSLCDTYRYRKYVVSFTDVPIEVCKERNLQRDKYKRVPEDVIEKMYSRFETQGKTSGWKEIPRDKFWDEFKNQCFDLSNYNKVHIIGDIHGCYEPLKEYIIEQSHRTTNSDKLEDYLNEDESYIFVGDYIDRGLQNKEVLEFIYNISQMKNVLLLEGNHERWIYYYATEQDTEIRSREFLKNTIPQIKDMDPSKLRQIYRKLAQLSYFSFKGQRYLVTHGGLSIMPECLQLISTNQFINGVGKFQIEIDKIYTNNLQDDVIQIHGHRNIEYSNDNKERKSYSLEDKVEFGQNLVVIELDGKNQILHYIKNNLFREDLKEFNEAKSTDQESSLLEVNMENIIDRLRNNPNIRESKLENNISSFNFTRKAFEKGKWDSETIKARGLFIDTENKKIVARGYEKFFNINEQENTKLFSLKRLFEEENESNEVVAYKKYNGFLGILSYYDNQLQFHSKSSNVGDYAMYFKNLFYKQYSTKQVEIIKQYLQTNDSSITFEVIDLENDPHIIDEKISRVVLLDIIHNTLDFEKEPYEKVVLLAKTLGLKTTEYKQIERKFKSYRELTEFYEIHKDEKNMDDTDIEGVVIESGLFMTKLKFNYYSFWKKMRSLSESVLIGKTVRTGGLLTPTANLFYKFLKDLYEDERNTLEKVKEQYNLQQNLRDIRRNVTIEKVDKDNSLLVLKVIDNSLIAKIKKLFNRKIVEIYKDKKLPIDQELAEKLEEVKRPKDIIYLRNKFLETQK